MNAISATREPPIIVALDFESADLAMHLVERLTPEMCRLKIGKELFTREGPQFIERLHRVGFEVFLDLKFHDIPNTTAQAVKAAAELGVWMLNVHASGGPAMLDAAAEALSSFTHRPKLIAVTVLTSFAAQQLTAIGIDRSLEEHVLLLATLSQQHGLDGVVCSALETQILRQKLGDDFCLVTPGIRPSGIADGDQTRVVSPQQALQWGSNYLVMGRPIRQHPEPEVFLNNINQQLWQLSDHHSSIKHE